MNIVFVKHQKETQNPVLNIVPKSMVYKGIAIKMYRIFPVQQAFYTPNPIHALWMHMASLASPSRG